MGFSSTASDGEPNRLIASLIRFPNVGGRGSFLVRIGLLASKEENAVVLDSRVFRGGSEGIRPSSEIRGVGGSFVLSFWSKSQRLNSV